MPPRRSHDNVSTRLHLLFVPHAWINRGGVTRVPDTVNDRCFERATAKPALDAAPPSTTDGMADGLRDAALLVCDGRAHNLQLCKTSIFSLVISQST
jgi:hypothetical protein